MFWLRRPLLPPLLLHTKVIYRSSGEEEEREKQLLELQRNRRWKGVFAFAPLLLSPFPTKAGANGEFTATTKAPDLGKEMGVAFGLGWDGLGFGVGRGQISTLKGVCGLRVKWEKRKISIFGSKRGGGKRVQSDRMGFHVLYKHGAKCGIFCTSPKFPPPFQKRYSARNDGDNFWGAQETFRCPYPYVFFLRNRKGKKKEKFLCSLLSCHSSHPKLGNRSRRKRKKK